jgi:NADPH-dependent 2,4-dienoyl-CoA reductase/sulfur reductase-like enzyme
MAAAIAASREGARVLLLDRNPSLGGILNQCIHVGFGLIRFGTSISGPEYAGIFTRQVEADTSIDYILGCMVTGITPDLKVNGLSREDVFRCEAKAVVFATGCRERTRGAIAIPGSRPTDIYTAGVAQQLINTHNIAVGKRTVILGSGDIGMIMARRLTLSGVEVVSVLEKLPYCSGLPRNRYQCLEDFGIPLHLNRTVTEIRGTKRLESVVASCLDEQGKPVSGSEYVIPCDTLILSVGLIPENEVVGKLGVELVPETKGVRVDSHLESSIPGVFSCGNSLQVNDLVDNVSAEGELAGKWAARHALGKSSETPVKLPVRHGAGIRYVTPQTVYAGETAIMSLRVNAPGRNKIMRFSSGKQILSEKKLKYVSPAEIISLELQLQNSISGVITVDIV